MNGNYSAIFNFMKLLDKCILTKTFQKIATKNIKHISALKNDILSVRKELKALLQQVQYVA